MKLKKAICLFCALSLLGVCGCTPTAAPSTPETEAPTPPVLYGNENTTLLKSIYDPMKETVPEVRYDPELDPYPAGTENEDPRIKALWFSSADYQGKKTEVFAYIGFPETATPDNPVPAIVLVHGGAGHAFADWVKLWVDRGYAAISMDIFGYAPETAAQTFDASWPVNPLSHPAGPTFGDSEKIEEQWMFYCVADILLCNNILRADTRVSSDKIGVTGVSWGGLGVAIAVGYDERFAYAMPVYGCGYLNESRGSFFDSMKLPGVADVWEPSLLLSKAKMPVLWMSSAVDYFFSVDALCKSKQATENGTLCINAIEHSYGPGIHAEELHRFADAIVFGYDVPLITAVDEQLEGDHFSCSLKIPEEFKNVRAEIIYGLTPRPAAEHYTDEIMTWAATLQQKYIDISEDGRIDITLPEGTCAFYISFWGFTSKSYGYSPYSSTLFYDIEK